MIPVGLFGLASACRRTPEYGWSTSEEISDLISYPALAIWILSTLLYLLRCKRHRQAVLAEFLHPVQGSLLSLFRLSVLLAIILLQRTDQGIWLLACAGALGFNGLIACRIIYLLATGQFPRKRSPRLYICP